MAVRGRRWTTAAVAVGAVVGSLGLVAAPASADQIWSRPTGGSLEISGHGFGHGRGMSQYGAHGAAAQGLSAARILAFYYPGTAATDVGNPLLAVRLDSVDANGSGGLRQLTEVMPASGLTAVAGSRKVVLPTKVGTAAVTRWLVSRNTATGALVVQYRDSSSTWHVYDLMGDKSAPPSPVTFWTNASASTSRVSVVVSGGGTRTYRGWIRAYAYNGGVRTVNAVWGEDYLRGVVASEMPASWEPAAVQAQAVAARSYAYYLRLHGGRAPGDICDTTSCQVYSGMAGEATAANAAIDATKGQVRTYNGSVALTEFSSADGGWTTAGSLPYQVAKADPYDGVYASRAHSWSTSLPTSVIERAFPTIGRLVRVRVVSRLDTGEWGGRITSIAVEGDQSTETVSGDGFKNRVNPFLLSSQSMLSNWFSVTRPDSFPRDWSGDSLADVLVTTSAGTVRTYPGDGSGGWGTTTTTGSGWSKVPWVATAGDLDGDGRKDLLAVNGSGALVLYRGNGASGFLAARTIGSGWGGFSEVVVPGDVDGDGYLDVLALRRTTRELVLYRGNGSGGWLDSGRGTVVQTLTGKDSVIPVGDWDGDGRPDVLVRGTSDGRMYLLSGTTTGFAAPRSIGSGWSAFDGFVGAGDVDGDGRSDLLARKAATGELWLYRGNGSGGWGSGQRVVGTGWNGLRLVR